jgi:hypothetical protein
LRWLEHALAAAANLVTRDPAQEMHLNIAYGHSLWGRPTLMAPPLEKALAIAETLDEPSHQLLPLWGLWVVKTQTGEYDEAVKIAERHGEISHAAGDQKAILGHKRILSLALHFAGKHERAKVLAGDVLTHPVTVNEAARDTSFQFDQRVVALALLARVQWMQGYPDQALLTAERSVEAAVAADHTLSPVTRSHRPVVP